MALWIKVNVFFSATMDYLQEKIWEENLFGIFIHFNSVYHSPLRFSKVKSFQERVRVSDHKPSKHERKQGSL